MTTQISLPRLEPSSSPTELSSADTTRVGGGLVGLLLLGGAALFLAGCQSRTAHGRAGKPPTTPPGD